MNETMKMDIEDVPRYRWLPFFNALGRMYEGWAVSVEVLAKELGDQRVVAGLPLQGITFEKAGSQAGDILIEAGDAGTPFIIHRVGRPRVVRSSVTGPGTEADVEIESEDGITRIIRLCRRPELPPPHAVSSGA
jgi:hypothetical protein